MTDTISVVSRAVMGRAVSEPNGDTLAARPPQPPTPPTGTVPRRTPTPNIPNGTVAHRLDPQLPPPPFAVRVLNRLTYGATAASIAEFNALGTTDQQRYENFVDWQLDWQAIDDSALDNRLNAAGFSTLDKTLPELWTDYVLPPNGTTGLNRALPAQETQRASFVRSVYSKRQLREVLANFWHAHFNVNSNDDTIRSVFVHYDRNVIRGNALGNFRAMLEAVARSTAMMYYLDNVFNTRAGPNENWAREMLELHTLGAANYLGFVNPADVPPAPEDPTYPIGYTDIDVYETASAFTGWTVKNGRNFPGVNDGTFGYNQAIHDAGPKQILGMFLPPEQPDMKDGQDVMDRLASHPRVAKFICGKLIRRLVSDSPDPALIDSAAAIFRQNWQAPDQIQKTVRHILLSPQAKNSWGNKRRRPFESIVAAMRVLDSNFTVDPAGAKSGEFMGRFALTGHSPYAWPAPNGYPDVAGAWSGANTTVMTWKMLNWLTESKTDNTLPDTAPRLVPILETSRSGVATWTATNLVNFWCRRVLGYLPVPSRRAALTAFMAQNGDPNTYVIADTDTSSGSDLKQHYNQQRLRTMVSMILLTPEFQSL